MGSTYYTMNVITQGPVMLTATNGDAAPFSQVVQFFPQETSQEGEIGACGPGECSLCEKINTF